MKRRRKVIGRAVQQNGIIILLLTIITSVSFSLILLPSLVTSIYGNWGAGLPDKENTVRVIQNPLVGAAAAKDFENYLVGVLAAEMPVSFEEEALKAQAVAARTYAFRQFIYSGAETLGADEIGQAYLDGEELINYRGKLEAAVKSTSGEILEYKEEPIEAVFHSASGGITEASENIWSRSLPYLKSVDSPGDENAPVYYDKKSFTRQEAAEILEADSSSLSLSVVERSQAGYATKVSAEGKVYSGSEIRNLFGLRSSNFDILNSGDEIIFETRGYGHGVGMSQYGANFMALEGKDYAEILKHYYQGVELKKIY